MTKLAYITSFRDIPSRKAHSVQVIKMSSAFAGEGLELELVMPPRKTNHQETSIKLSSTWDYYGIPKNFKITRLPAISRRTIGFTPLAIGYAHIKRYELIFTRQIDVAYSAALSGKPSIFSSHNYFKVKNKRLLKYWLNLFRNPKRSIAMVVTTRAGARAYEALGVPPERLFIAPNGVDTGRFNIKTSKAILRETLNLPQSRTIVGYSGHLYQRKGAELLLEAAKFLKDVFFLIVGGEPDDIERCQSSAQQMKLSNISFKGFVPPPSVASYLLATDVLILPQRTTDPVHQYMSPMKAFDYLASGRPIVASDLPTFREILQNRQNAILVPPDSGQALATGIQQLIDNPALADEIGKNARQDAQKYSWENRAKRLISWFKDILEF